MLETFLTIGGPLPETSLAWGASGQTLVWLAEGFVSAVLVALIGRGGRRRFARRAQKAHREVGIAPRRRLSRAA